MKHTMNEKRITALSVLLVDHALHLDAGVHP